MNSLFARILLWLWVSVMAMVIGSAFISAITMSRDDTDRRAPGGQLISFQLSQARFAYETSGKAGLAKFLATVNRIYSAQGILTNENGRDLLTGENRSDLVARARRRPPYRFFRAGNAMVARAADDGRYWYFFAQSGTTVGLWFL